MEGKLVEYIDSQKILLGFCLEEKKDRIRILTTANRESSLNKKRIYLVSQETYSLARPKHQILQLLKDESQKREILAQEIDVISLWELLEPEGGSYSIRELAEFYFPQLESSAQEGAIFRALFADRIHFKLKGRQFEVQPQEKVNQILKQQAKEAKQRQKIAEFTDWLKKVWESQANSPLPEGTEELLQAIKDWCIFKEDAPKAKLAKEMLKAAGLNTEDHPFQLLVRLGHFSRHENLLIHRLRVPTKFDAESKQFTNILIKSPPDFLDNREDLTSLLTYTIDGPETKDYDDALSLEKSGNAYTVGIHITDLTPFIPKGSTLDEEARQRITTVYFPEGKIPMLPEAISEDLASLTKRGVKPSLSFLVSLDANGTILNYRIVPGLIKISEHLTYDQVNNLLTEDKTFNMLYQLALAFRQKRLKQGGMIISLPELIFSFAGNEVVGIKQRSFDEPSRVLVAEFMIMANYLAALFLSQTGIPALYRIQPPPKERLMNGISDDLLTLYLQRKLLNRSFIDLKPGFHHIIGLDKYTSITSPLRKYMDMVMQRQLIYYLQHKKTLYSEEELSLLIPQIEEGLKRTAYLCSQRIRYWILCYLKRSIRENLDAYVIGETHRGYRLLLPEYLLETDLNAPKANLKYGDKVRVRLETVNPQKEILKVVLS